MKSNFPISSTKTETTEISQQPNFSVLNIYMPTNVQGFSFSPLNVLKNMSNASKLLADSKSTPVSNLQ